MPQKYKNKFMCEYAFLSQNQIFFRKKSSTQLRDAVRTVK